MPRTNLDVPQLTLADHDRLVAVAHAARAVAIANAFGWLWRHGRALVNGLLRPARYSAGAAGRIVLPRHASRPLGE